MTMPREASDQPGPFDRFADLVARVTSRAVFFTACVLLVVLWAPSIFLIKTVDTWQLIINTATTIVTFLLVALDANAQKRSTDAEQQKLNAIAAFLLDPTGDNRAELESAVGLEKRETSDSQE